MSSASLPAGHVVGPALHFGGTYTDRIKTYHTMDPAYSAHYRMYPTVNNIVAMQQLNQQGLFPTGNSVVDFTGGSYPANIPLQPRKDAPAGCGVQYGQGFTDWRGNEARVCHACAPGLVAEPMQNLVARQVVSKLAGTAVAPANVASREIGALGSAEVQHYDRVHFGSAASEYGGAVSIGCGASPNTFSYARQTCGRSLGDIVERSTSAGCAGYTAANVGGAPYPYNERHPSEDGDAGFVGYVDQAHSRSVAAASATPAAPAPAGKVVHPEVAAALDGANRALAEARNHVAGVVADADAEEAKANEAANKADMNKAVEHTKNAEVKKNDSRILIGHLKEAAEEKEAGVALAKQGQTAHALVAIQNATAHANHVQSEAVKSSNNGKSKAEASSSSSVAAIQASSTVVTSGAHVVAGKSLSGYRW